MENQLTKSDNQAINLMPIHLQKYALAKQGELISKMSVKFAIKSIYEVLAKALVDSGQNKAYEKEKVELVILNISENVYQLICDKYKSLSINEFKLACLNGSIGEYGDYFGINLKTVSDWLKGYLNDENKRKAMAEWNRLLELVVIQPKTDAQKDEIIVNGCIHYFEQYKQAGLLKQILVPVNSLCAVFYDNLKSKGLLIITKERKNELYDKALAEYKTDLEAKAKDRESSFKAEQIKPLLDSIVGNNNKTFANICKRMALMQYFDELIEMDQDLKDILIK